MVEVRSPAEILATLDDRAATENMPFMPEMLQYAGRRFTVNRRVEKICDTVGKVTGEPSVSRRMRGTVYLEDLRCDGSAHGGCQAGCRLYWKEDWLRQVDSDALVGGSEGFEALAALTAGATTPTPAVGNGFEKELFRCQATDAWIASEPLGATDPRQYVREVTAGNASAAHVVWVLGRYGLERAFAFGRMFGSRFLSRLSLRRAHRSLERPGEGGGLHRPEGIQPGDLVRVRSLDEIDRTLVDGRHRGLWFDAPEMGTFCGGTFTVKDRVRRIIDDRNGEMIELKSDCLILDGVCCTGERSSRRWFCPRAIYSFWREDWLELVQKGPTGVRSHSPQQARPRAPSS
jgi:hypothetical protein